MPRTCVNKANRFCLICVDITLLKVYNSQCLQLKDQMNTTQRTKSNIVRGNQQKVQCRGTQTKFFLFYLRVLSL